MHVWALGLSCEFSGCRVRAPAARSGGAALAEVELSEVEIGRSRASSKSITPGFDNPPPDKATLTGLLDVNGGGAALPSVRMFCGRPSQYLWEVESHKVKEESIAMF